MPLARCENVGCKAPKHAIICLNRPPKTWIGLRASYARSAAPRWLWGAKESLDVWVIEQRARLDQEMSERIRSSSWALVAATVGLVICTAGLIWATLVH